MSTMYRYALPVELTEWKFEGTVETRFTWEYEDEREGLLQLYDKGKKQQWDAALRIDWSQDLDPENPQQLDDRVIPIFGTDIWRRLSEKEKIEVRHHQQAASLSQFMHGEQGALIATAKIVQSVPDLDAKFYAATQVMDEARHVEAYSRLLHEKMQLAYPITPGLKSLLETGLSDSRWDMTYLTMQILIEGLALRDFYPQLTQSERDEREDFVVQACYHMRDRFNQLEVWERLGLPAKECVEAVMTSESMAQFRTRLFSRIVPTVKDIGLWGSRVQKAFADMGVMSFADVDAQAMLENDSRVAEQFDAKRRVAEVQASAAE
jgi:para-aminobenzoate N-oxygenase AurF